MAKIDSAKHIVAREVVDSTGTPVGYIAHMSGMYVCYECGHLCVCGEEEE